MSRFSRMVTGIEVNGACWAAALLALALSLSLMAAKAAH